MPCYCSITYFHLCDFNGQNFGVLTVSFIFCADSGTKVSDGEFSSNDANSDGNKKSTGSIKRKNPAKKVRWKENEIGKQLLSARHHNGPTSGVPTKGKRH